MHSRLGAVFVAVFALGGGLTVLSVPADAGHTPTCLNRKATIVGTPGNDTLRGTSKADVIVGLGGHDSITGRCGSDYICGGGGRDVIDAGDGSDSLSGGAGDDRLVARQADPDLPDEFYADPGTDVYIEKGTVPDEPSETPAIFYTDAPRGIHADLAKGSIHGWGHDIVRFPLGATIYGTAHDDTLLGSRYGDNLQGSRGDDHLDGRGGPDYVTDDHGHDVLDGGAGPDVMAAAERHRARVVRGNAGDDRISFVLSSSGRRALVVKGGAGDDLVIGGLPDDARLDLHAGPGNDGVGLTARERHDTTQWKSFALDIATGVGHAGGRSFTAAGFEGVSIHDPRRGGGSAASYTLSGTDGPNDLTIDHTPSPMFETGLGGDDYLVSSSGDDTLDGGDGTDYGAGNDGTNTCISIETAGPGC
jgi:Ca2+-binding RTX toxin-like protein